MNGRPGYMRKMSMLMSVAEGVISRRTLRAVVPPGDVGNAAMRRHLGNCYERGHASPGKYFVRVLDADALRRYALDGLPGAPTFADFVHVPSLVETVRRQISCEPNPAIRRLRLAEVALLERLGVTA
jgi:hypothetical protein